MRSALQLATPAALERLALCLAQIVMTAVVTGMGPVAVAANYVAVQTESICYLPAYGIATAATALVGSALGIKPVLHVDNEGHLINVSKARGRKNSILALVDRMERSAIEPEKQTVFISHGDCLADAEFLAQEVRRRLHVPRIEINYVGPVIGAHSGPGTLALFFLGTAR